MAIKNEKMKLIVVDEKGSIPELGGITGPIINPTLQPISIIMNLVTARRRVYEVNPTDYTKKVLLTRKNVNIDNFPVKSVKANVTPAVIVEKKNDTVVDNKTNNVYTTNKKDNNKNDFTKK